MPDINNARLLLKRYRAGAVSLTDRIVENEQWYNMRHLQSVSTDKYLPASAWLFNSLAVKHADAMEAMPVPYVTAREPGDTESAEALSKILPVILERNDFRGVYSAIWNDKLKHGTGCYGVFWNPEANGMLGEIEIKRIDVLNLFFEPGCTELDASPNLFHCELKSIDEARRYMHGEEIACESGLSGYVAVRWRGCTIGGGKASGGVIKNHYPKGLRL